MKKEIWRGQNSVRFIYYSYKDSTYFSFLLAGLAVLFIFILVFNIVIPQLQNWFSIRNEVIKTQEKIAILNKNIEFISSVNKSDLENKRQIIINAVPVDKDFSSIINAVNMSSLNSGVSVDDFSFGLGTISSSSAIEKKKSNLPDSIQVSLSLKGSIDSVKNFIKEIGEKLPLSQVESVDTGDGITNLSILFYSKSYRAPNIADDEPIVPISSQNNTLLNTLSEWNSSLQNTSQEPPQRSPSTPLF